MFVNAKSTNSALELNSSGSRVIDIYLKYIVLIKYIQILFAMPIFMLLLC